MAAFASSTIVSIDRSRSAKITWPTVKPTQFEYHAPETVVEAATILAELGDDAKVLAGGQSLIPMLSLRLAVFDHLVDIGRIGELKGIDVETGRSGSVPGQPRRSSGRAPRWQVPCPFSRGPRRT